MYFESVLPRFLFALANLTLHGRVPWSQTQHASSRHWPELRCVLHVCACVSGSVSESLPRKSSSRMEDLKENLGTLDWCPGITRGRPEPHRGSCGFKYIWMSVSPFSPFLVDSGDLHLSYNSSYLWRAKCHSPKGLWSHSFCAGTRSPTMKVCFSRTCVPSATWFFPGPCDSCPTWLGTLALYFRSWKTTSLVPTNGSGSSRTK